MTIKHLIAAAILIIALLGGTTLACVSRRIRDLFFFLMVTAQLYFDKMDVNFFSQEWYRGTTRGLETSLLDVLAFALLVGCVISSGRRLRLFWPASLGFMVLFLAFEGLSVLMSEPKIFGAFEAAKMFRAIVVFMAAAFYIRSDRELRILVIGLACAVCIEMVYALRQKIFWHMDRSPGTFDAPNSLSLYICTVGPILVAGFNAAFPKWVRGFLLCALGAALVNMLLAVSRAGLPVFGLVVLGATLATMSWRITPRKILFTLGIGAAVTLAVAGTWDNLKERYTQSTLQEEIDPNQYENRSQYFALAREILKDHATGVGLNNWSYWVSKIYGPRLGARYEDYDAIPTATLENPEIYNANPNYAPPAHNLFVLTVGEMGWIALGVFLLLWLRWFQMGAKFLWIKSSEPILRMGTGFFFALCGMFLQSQTEWVYRQTTVMMTFYVILGGLASLYFLKRQRRRQARVSSVLLTDSQYGPIPTRPAVPAGN